MTDETLAHPALGVLLEDASHFLQVNRSALMLNQFRIRTKGQAAGVALVLLLLKVLVTIRLGVGRMRIALVRCVLT